MKKWLTLIGMSLLGACATISNPAGDKAAPVATGAQWLTNGASTAAVSNGPIAAAALKASNVSAGPARALPLEGKETQVTRYFVNDWTARDASKFLEFEITAQGRFAVDAISAYLASSGGSTVVADMDYSVDGTTWIKLNEKPLGPARDTMQKFSFPVKAELAAGGKLQLRVYPWNPKGGPGVTGKYLAIHGVNISGKPIQ